MNTGCNISILILLIALGKSHNSWHIIAFKEFRIKYICKLLEKKYKQYWTQDQFKKGKENKTTAKKIQKIEDDIWLHMRQLSTEGNKMWFKQLHEMQGLQHWTKTHTLLINRTIKKTATIFVRFIDKKHNPICTQNKTNNSCDVFV